jgi:membrane protein required for colicin V production
VNGFDVALALLAAVLVVYGLLRGLVRLVLSAVSLVAAFVAANLWHEDLATHWAASGASSSALRIAAWAVLFGAVVLGGALLGWLVARFLQAASLGWADRLAGGALGLLLALLAGGAVALPIVAYGGPEASLLRRSRLAPYVTAVSDWLNIAAPDGLAHRYEGAARALKRDWRERARHG